ncbi:MAG TPA: hypothetical protein VGP47_10510, partial [Parachlamydiaceae bacterium]|nr:hypothetical protein [Parachlamydiaceae bacterium]
AKAYATSAARQIPIFHNLVRTTCLIRKLEFCNCLIRGGQNVNLNSAQGCTSFSPGNLLTPSSEGV